jgi:hypothetical protein
LNYTFFFLKQAMYNHTKKRASQWLGIIMAIIMIMKVEAGTQKWYASKLETKEGTASPVSLQALTINDQKASQDSWNKYVEFYGSRTAYKGIFTFDLAGCNVANVQSYQLDFNFKGPTYAYQQWTLEYYVPANQSWNFAGNNKDAANWYWTPLSFKGTIAFSSLVGSNGKLQLRLSSTKRDNCDLDYLAITTSTDTEATVAPTTPATVAPTTPATVSPTTPATVAPTIPATASPRPTTTPTQKPTTPPTVTPTQKPTTSPTVTPTQKPTTTPTTAPTVPPTQKPTTTPTKTPTTPPTQKPTTTPTIAPTQKPTTAPTTPATAAPSQAPGGGRLCPAGQIWAPAPGTTWQWQLTGSIDQTWDVQMYDIDLFDTSISVINSLHSKGRAVICYFSTQYEDWRPDASKFTSDVLGNNLDDWPGERFVDIRSSKLRQIMTERLDLAVSKGCDGVEPDNVDGYANNNGLGLTAANQLDYNKFLAQEAHKRGLSIGLKNDLDQVAALVTHFDWALNEQCNQYNECNYLNPFVTAGKAVFGVDYSGTATKICPTMVTAQFSWLMKDLSLGAKGTQCCTYASNGCAKASYRCITY